MQWGRQRQTGEEWDGDRDRDEDEDGGGGRGRAGEILRSPPSISTIYPLKVKPSLT